MDKISALMRSALARQSAGDMDGAIGVYRQILLLKPDSIEALCNLGGAMHAKGLLSDAITCYRNALAVAPKIPQLYYNMAGAHQAIGEIDLARKNYAQATALKPDYLEAHFSIGMLDIQTGRHNDALTRFQTILAVNPNNADALNGIGICFKNLGDSCQALEYFQRALNVNPNHFEALGNIAAELLSRSEFDKAIEANTRALALRPGEPKVLYNLGVAYREKKRFEDAADCFRKVVAVDPSAAHARLDLARTLQAVCDWRQQEFSIRSTAKLVEEILDSNADTEIDLFNALSLPLDNKTLLRIAERTSRKIEHRSTHLTKAPDPTEYTAATRLRVGYLSPKYRNHPGAHLMGGLLKAHDRDKFEIFAYSIGPNDESVYRRRAEADAEHFVDLYSKPLAKCIERIRSDRIHVLVDLAGYTTGARPEIFAARSAPIQINYLGFPGSLGADFFDYIITDTIISPPTHQEFFRETFAYLPHCYQINDDRNEAAEIVPPRSEYGLPEKAFVFCCFNNNYKIDSEIFRTWTNILLQVPGSVLWLLTGSELQMENLRQEASSHGLDPERIIFSKPVDKAAHLARHAHADLFLDTLYYNAHTTGSDALRQAVPMITCQGDTFASRVGSSLLQAVGLDELVTADLDQYTHKAVQLGTDGTLMSRIRSKLAGNLPQSSLLDNPRFARNLENLYQIMWQRFTSGEAPRQIAPDDTSQPATHVTLP